MIKRHKYSLIVLSAVCSMMWIACKQSRQPCLTPKTASLTVETVHRTSLTDTTAADTGLIAALFIPLTAKVDTFAYGQSSQFILSLSPVSDSCRWAFKTDTLNTLAFDTVTFFYKREPQFLSNACGYTYFYKLDSVRTTHINIDSFRIMNTNVTNDANAKHLQIFIHPDF